MKKQRERAESEMRFDSRFLKQVVTILVASAGLSAYPLWKSGSVEIVEGVVMGAVLSTINVLAGYATIEYSFTKSYSTFLKMVLGGMGVRMGFVLVALLLLIKVFKVHTVALVSSLLGFYVIFLILEVIFIQRKLTQRNQE
jgi:hypothetical protein